MISDSKPPLDSNIVIQPNIITQPSHYVEGRVFEPISVIEDFGICHHLACTLKYIARAGRKTSFLNDLLKGEWYLDREIAHLKTGVGSCNLAFVKLPNLKVLDICEDWNLSPNLEEVLSCILHYRLAAVSGQRFQWIRRLFKSSCSNEFLSSGDYLVKAREYLRLEIAAHTREKLGCNEQRGCQ